MPGINWLDFILIMLLAVGLAVGYMQGLLRQVIGLAAMYVAAVLATQYFHLVANFLKGLLSTTPGALLNMIGFFVIMFAVMGIVNFLALDAYKMTKLRLMPLLDHFGGMVAGLASSWILITLAINVLTFATVTAWGTAESYRLLIKNGSEGSELARMAEATLPTIMTAITPWLPTGLPAIFKLQP